MRLIFRDVNLAQQEAYAFLELEGGRLELIQTLDRAYVPPPLEPPFCPHLALGTQDLSAVLETIKARGIPIVKGPLEIPGEERWLYLRDPDNNVIEYIQWVARKV